MYNATWEIIHYFLAKAQLQEKQKILLFAITHNKSQELLQFLILNGADLNFQNQNGETILHCILRRTKKFDNEVKQENLDVIDFLIKSGSDLNITDNNDESCLMIMAKNRNYTTFKALLARNKLVLDPNNIISVLSYLIEIKDQDLV